MFAIVYIFFIVILLFSFFFEINYWSITNDFFMLNLKKLKKRFGNNIKKTQNTKKNKKLTLLKILNTFS